MHNDPGTARPTPGPDEYAVIVQLIGKTTTTAGLQIRAELDEHTCPPKETVTDEQLANVRLGQAAIARDPDCDRLSVVLFVGVYSAVLGSWHVLRLVDQNHAREWITAGAVFAPVFPLVNSEGSPFEGQIDKSLKI